MTDDLLKRLRCVGGHHGTTRWYTNPDGPEAADRIDALEAENKALREGLEFYSDKANWLVPYIAASPVVIDGGHRARALLEKEEIKRNLQRITDAWVRERAQRDYLEMVLKNIKHQLDKALQ